MPTDKSQILIRVQPPMKVALKKAAQEERRSLSNLVEHVMAEWLQQKAKRKPK